mgnify:CR=1 FL=1|jgi:hypothetical protein
MYINRIRISLTKNQAEELKHAGEVLDYLRKNRKPGALLGQVFIGDLLPPHPSHGYFDIYILPAYVAKAIERLLRRKPSGKLKRRRYDRWKKAARKGIWKYFDYNPVTKRRKIASIEDVERYIEDDDIPF